MQGGVVVGLVVVVVVNLVVVVVVVVESLVVVVVDWVVVDVDVSSSNLRKKFCFSSDIALFESIVVGLALKIKNKPFKIFKIFEVIFCNK